MLQVIIYDILMVLGGILMGMTTRRFLPNKSGRMYMRISVLLFSAVIGIPSWIGDENPLILLPFFLAVYLICFKGPWYARLIIGAIFYTLLLPMNMIIDSAFTFSVHSTVMIKTAMKLLIWGIIWLLVRHFVPKERKLVQSAKLWVLLGGLSLAPLFATLSFTIWNARGFEEAAYYSIALRLSYTILPFTIMSALALLVAMAVLSRHEELEQQKKLTEIQGVYYQGLQREQSEVRTLRHDLHNHVAVAQSLLEYGDYSGIKRYLEELSCSPALQGSRRVCENDIANAVFSSKAAILESEGIQADLAVSLPQKLAITDIELCALLGNALDNAIEAAMDAQDKRIIVRARTDKGVLMLRVENALGKQPRREQGVFKTTKDNLGAHGFGLAGIRDIVRRYGGSLDAKAENGRFELVVYVPLNVHFED